MFSSLFSNLWGGWLPRGSSGRRWISVIGGWWTVGFALSSSQAFVLDSSFVDVWDGDVLAGSSVTIPYGGYVGVFSSCCGRTCFVDGAACVCTWAPGVGSPNMAFDDPSGVWWCIVPFVFGLVDVTFLPSSCRALSSLGPPGCSLGLPWLRCAMCLVCRRLLPPSLAGLVGRSLVCVEVPALLRCLPLLRVSSA